MNKKQKQLGMNPSTASNRLKKMIIYNLAGGNKLNCFRCGDNIESCDDLSIDHIEDWLDSHDPKRLFFDVDNVAFSHKKCNYGARRNPRRGYGKSKYIGVNLSSGQRLKNIRYKSEIYINGSSVFIGNFDTEKEAARAYDRFVLDNNLDRPINFPTPTAKN